MSVFLFPVNVYIKRIKALLKQSNASTSIKRLGKENRTKIFEKDILQKCGRNCERRLLLSRHTKSKCGVVAGSDLGFAKKIVRFAMTSTSSENCEQVPSQTIFSKNKTHLKLKHKSIGQGRGGMEGTVRPSQLRAGSPPKKRIQKKISLRG